MFEKEAAEELLKDLDQFSEDVPTINSNNVQVIFPERNLEIPVAGKIYPSQLHEYFGVNESIDIKNVSIITTENSFTDSYSQMVDSKK